MTKQLRFTTLILTVFLVLFLFGCAKLTSEKDDNLAPIITCEDTYDVEVGDSSFSLIDLITINDDLDGEILARSSMIDYKNFDINVLGLYEVILKVSDSSGSSTNKAIIINVVDSTLPSIHLTGEGIVNIVIGNEYVELGATLIDNYDTELVLTVLGEVDTDIIAEYVLEYFTEDLSGNRSESIFRTINVGVIFAEFEVLPLLTTEDDITPTNDYDFTGTTITELIIVDGKGYIYSAAFQGYKSTITYMIGIDLDGNLTGYITLTQGDTPGLGALIAEIDFYQQFIGMKTEDAGAGNFDGIASASITTRGLIDSLSKFIEFNKEEFE